MQKTKSSEFGPEVERYDMKIGKYAMASYQRANSIS